MQLFRPDHGLQAARLAFVVGLRCLRGRFTQAIRIDDLAGIAEFGVSAFRRQFKLWLFAANIKNSRGCWKGAG